MGMDQLQIVMNQITLLKKFRNICPVKIQNKFKIQIKNEVNKINQSEKNKKVVTNQMYPNETKMNTYKSIMWQNQ